MMKFLPSYCMNWCRLRTVLIKILATLAAGFHELGLASWMLYAFLTLVPSFNYVVFPCVQVRTGLSEKILTCFVTILSFEI